MDSIQQAVFGQIKTAGQGKVFTPKDFLSLGERTTIDQALSRLTRSGHIQRLGRGLYYYPRTNPRLGIPVPPDVEEIAEALGRQTGSRVIASGAVAANRLGLSTQVPAKLIYLTDGRSRRLRLGSLDFQIKHVAPKELPVGNRTSAMVFQALRHLGRESVGIDAIEALRSVLSVKQRRQLLEDARYTTDWIANIARLVAQPRRKQKESGRG